jgi:hypothetical protein
MKSSRIALTRLPIHVTRRPCANEQVHCSPGGAPLPVVSDTNAEVSQKGHKYAQGEPQIHTLVPATTPLWSSGQSSWLRIQRFRFDSRNYQIFWEVVGLERGPFSLVSVSTIEELLGSKSSGSCLESREYDRRDPLRWPRGALYPQSWH